MSAGPSDDEAVTRFNHLPAEDAGRSLLACLRCTGWAGSLLAGRPYPDRESLLARADALALALDDAELDSALAAHPRIGERAAGGGREADHSRREQGAVDGEDVELAGALRAGNLAYEQRFGRVFLIRAAGRSGADILRELTRRLADDPQAEAVAVREQLAQIARLRLVALLEAPVS